MYCNLWVNKILGLSNDGIAEDKAEIRLLNLLADLPPLGVYMHKQAWAWET